MPGYLSDALKPDGDPFAGMSPINAFKLRQELAARQTVTPEQRAANLKQTGWEALSVIPGPANAISAKDAWDSGKDAVREFGQGNLGRGALASALAGLSGFGAVTGLPTSKMAGRVARDAPDMASAFPAWHGSPHDFDAFDMSKVGTGEKALTRYGNKFADRGYGHYFADEREVGDSYRAMMAGDGGKLYNVSLDVEPDQLLHWNKAMADQSPGVQQALRGVSADFSDTMTGGDIYKALESQANRRPEEVSRLLRESGIPGTRYEASQDPSKFAAYQGKAVPSDEGATSVRTAVSYLDKAGGDVNKAMQDVVATADRVGWPDADLNAIMNHLASGDIALNQTARPHNYVIFDDKLVSITGKE